MRARFFDRQDGEIIRNSKHRAPFLAELVSDTGTTLLIGLGSNGGGEQAPFFPLLGEVTRNELGVEEIEWAPVVCRGGRGWGGGGLQGRRAAARVVGGART